MQELIEELKANDVAHGMYWIKQPNDFFEKYLEKEKEQTCNAFSRGLGTELGLDWEDSEQYYNRIYQNK